MGELAWLLSQASNLMKSEFSSASCITFLRYASMHLSVFETERTSLLRCNMLPSYQMAVVALLDTSDWSVAMIAQFELLFCSSTLRSKMVHCILVSSLSLWRFLVTMHWTYPSSPPIVPCRSARVAFMLSNSIVASPTDFRAQLILSFNCFLHPPNISCHIALGSRPQSSLR